ncbi:hypothetical protein AMATHDRAFT_54780 [Amanita thiersii Skay4041]|uniref:Cerato-platanin n=1 Tax=Amanita thiersii Skay4041 TaxID=703135 RepID=A0A2A9NRH6_9AGAR|nr:hypothetical protein AMATHDRAFT_54780 [Amanita thiersii Skay4041]
MKSILRIAALALSILPAYSITTTVAYDQVYDNSGGSLTTVACSDGPNGMITRGFTTFGSLPGFPHIGAAFAVTGWSSDGCGTCWKLTYTNAQGQKKSINVIAIDVAGSGFNIALAAMNELTNNQAVQLGRVTVDATQLDESSCGL